MHISSRATRGVKIPNKKQAREEIVSLFKAQMNKLKQRLNVHICLKLPLFTHLNCFKSQCVAGDISLTCCMAGVELDGYFAVTGHWIEEHSPGKWTLKHALFGFTQMNTAHNGDRLGRALFKICHRLSVVHRGKSQWFCFLVSCADHFFEDWSHHLQQCV